MKSNKKEYTAPELTVVTFRAERGYALSGILAQMMLWESAQLSQMENFETGNDWNSGSDNFWL